jgi:hypothetical protein
MSFKTEVCVDGKWASNALRFATEREAQLYGTELLSRWFVPTDARPAESPDPVNYKFDEQQFFAVALN